MKNFSPNMLKTYQSCPLKYNLKFNEKITIPQNPAFFEKGKKIHALANYYHRGADITKLEKALNESEREIWKRLKNNEYFSKKCLHSEYPITAKIDDIWIFGRLDAIVCEAVGEVSARSFEVNEKDTGTCGQLGPDEEKCASSHSYWILDYKTGSIPKNPEKDFQTMIYLLCADLILPPRKSLSFVYIDLKNNENKVIEFTPELKEFYENTIKQQCREILATKDFEGKENREHCRFCEYNKICRY